MYSQAFREKFIDAYTQNGFKIISACKIMGIEYNTFKAWMNETPMEGVTPFKEIFEKAEASALQLLIEEAEATHRVVRLGIPKKDKEGALIGWKERPDARSIEWFLSRIAKKYNDTLNVKHSGDQDNPIKISYK